jgi:small-conductance mechanosensitive channel
MPYLLALKALPWKLIGLAALGMFIGGLFLALKMEQSQNAKLKAQLHECTSLRAQDRTNYIAAQKAAEAENKAQVQSIESQYQRNNDEAVANLNARLERLRRELSQGGTAAPQSHPVKPGLPQAGDPTPAPGATGVCYPPEVILRAAENEERFDELITLIQKQMNVDPNR